MRRAFAALTLVAACLLLSASAVADWHSEQPIATGIGVPSSLGPVGDIEFWAPNRGLLITQGNDAMPAGLYAYDGSGWYLYSTVCGGHEGRIAWAGPDEFWTVSDQQKGQELTGGAAAEEQLFHRSLCHFKDGRVVASYAEPIGTSTSYEPLAAAACNGPDDCWFAGERLPGIINTGAFHLHWGGHSLSAIPSLSEPEPELEDPARAVKEIAYHQGQFYESVQPQQQGDAVLHRIEPGAATPFAPLFTEQPIPGTLAEFDAFRLSSDGEQLWAIAGASLGGSAAVTALRLGSAGFAQIPLQPGVFSAGDRVAGLAAEPGADSAWVSFAHQGESATSAQAPARLARVHAGGAVDPPVLLPGEADGIGHKGGAGPIACPAAEQCWMATGRGWLFHLGGPLPADNDPAMHGLITQRPPDNGLPFVSPDDLPEDDSGAELPPDQVPLPLRDGFSRRPRARALVSGVRQRLIDGTVLELTFTLRAKAHVQLRAKRRKRIVAKTKRYTMAKGRRHLRLRLDPQSWPTSLDLQAHAIVTASRSGMAKAFRAFAIPTALRGDAPLAVGSPLPSPAAIGAPASRSLPAQLMLGLGPLTMVGASPGEAPGEVWATGGSQLRRYTDAGGWQAMPAAVDAGNQPIAGLGYVTGALAGRATSDGGLAVAAQAGSTKLLVVRDPGGTPHATPDPGPQLSAGESLFATSGSPRVLAAPVDEPGGHTGVFVAPAVSGSVVQTSVLHFDSSSWVREPICLGAWSSLPCQAPSAGFKVLAIDAGGPADAWLLATKGPASAEGVVLLSRDASRGQWRQRSLDGSLGALYAQAMPSVAVGVTVKVAPRTLGQALTVTDQGVWVDSQLTIQGTAKPVDATLFYTPDASGGTGQVSASWCDVPAALASLCEFPLGSELPADEGRSFAWPSGGGSVDPYGRRVITGVGQGAILSFAGTSFSRVPLVGGDAGAANGAALAAPDEGWLGSSLGPIHLTSSLAPDRLQSWPVPFRRPLLAIAPQPGAAPGALSSQALAVGDRGEVARYAPGQGWVPEPLLSASGARATPRLRGVAWPEPGRAYAVGDRAEMWLWRSATGLWEPDPARPPNLIRANFTGIAFDPSNPTRGYAIGKQGVLLGYGRQWKQEQLPAGLNPEVNFTSIAFAGSEALVTYKFPLDNTRYAGGLLVNDGSGWRIEQGIGAALPSENDAVPERVAGLPDGGAAIAAQNGVVVERNGAGAPWARVPGSPGGYPVALAAIREGGLLRAIVSTEAEGLYTGAGSRLAGWETDSDQIFNQAPPGQAPLLTDPYPMPYRGYVMRQTGDGWRSEEHPIYPLPEGGGDWPLRPDPVLALLQSPDGSQGWAVGGDPGVESTINGASVQTADVLRYSADAAPLADAARSPIAPTAGSVSLAVGGNAQCAVACADLAGTGIGPDVWLPAAVARAGEVAGVRAFLYTGPGVAEKQGEKLSAQAYARESDRYAERLSSSAGSLPVYAAPAASDRDGANSLASFMSSFSGFDAPLGGAPAGAGITPVSPALPSQGYYAFDSSGEGGTVRVVVLDYSAKSKTLGETKPLGEAQECWLAQQLAGAKAAKAPAIVVGNRDLGAQAAATAASDAATVVPILVTGSRPGLSPACAGAQPGAASAYFFDFPEQNRSYQLSFGGRSIPSFGSGTLGYITPPLARQADFVGASGFLLASVNVAGRDPATNVAPVGVRLIPDIGELAIDATDGTLLRRSQPALFGALARRPKAGTRCMGGVTQGCQFVPDPYIPIPSQCQGLKCASGIFPEYRFISSNPDIADFVKLDPASTNPRHVLLGKNGRPILDPTSGLLCAFNAGTTTVTVETGGLVYSTPVTVQRGSVQRPCGTTPLRNQPVRVPAIVPPPPVSPSPSPNLTNSPTSLPPPSPPAGPTPAPPPPPVVHSPVSLPLAAPFFAAAPALTPVVPIVPPAPPPAAQPTPPSGTSPVTQPVTAPEPEREEEVAFDLVHHMAAHRPPAPQSLFLAAPDSGGGGVLPSYLVPALVLFAALSGASLMSSRRRHPQLAHQLPTTPRRSRR